MASGEQETATTLPAKYPNSPQDRSWFAAHVESLPPSRAQGRYAIQSRQFKSTEHEMSRGFMRENGAAVLAVAAFIYFMPAFASAQAPAPSTTEAKSIAAEAYLYAYPMLYNYKTLFQQTVDPSFPGYIGGFNRYRHYSRGFTPADKDIVTPSNDTPYSWAWLDLRAEPMVVSVPASDRYYVLQWFDLYTHNFAYIGSRATGTEAGTICSPDPAGTARPRRASRKSSARKRS